MTADCSSGGKLPRAFGYAGFLLAASSLERQRMSRPNELAATLAAPFPFLLSRSGYHRFARGRSFRFSDRLLCFCQKGIRRFFFGKNSLNDFKNSVELLPTLFDWISDPIDSSGPKTEHLPSLVPGIGIVSDGTNDLGVR